MAERGVASGPCAWRPLSWPWGASGRWKGTQWNQTGVRHGPPARETACCGRDQRGGRGPPHSPGRTTELLPACTALPPRPTSSSYSRGPSEAGLQAEPTPTTQPAVCWWHPLPPQPPTPGQSRRNARPPWKGESEPRAGAWRQNYELSADEPRSAQDVSHTRDVVWQPSQVSAGCSPKLSLPITIPKPAACAACALPRSLVGRAPPRPPTKSLAACAWRTRLPPSPHVSFSFGCGEGAGSGVRGWVGPACRAAACRGRTSVALGTAVPMEPARMPLWLASRSPLASRGAPKVLHKSVVQCGACMHALAHQTDV